jgi:hypothetical protein
MWARCATATIVLLNLLSNRFNNGGANFGYSTSKKMKMSHTVGTARTIKVEEVTSPAAGK